MQNPSTRRPPDPFAYKSLSKWHPKRVAFTLRARWKEWSAANNFRSYTFPAITLQAHESLAPFDSLDTAVTPEQMRCLLAALHQTEHLPEPMVEIGSYRGVTTAQLATRTRRRIIAIDPYIGYGGGEKDLAIFQKRTAPFANIEHWKMTSGEGARKMKGNLLSLVFVDAVHDYVNTFFDGWTWGELLRPQGCVAFHDTNDTAFPGTRRAVWELSQAGGFKIMAHIPGLIILQKVSSPT